VKGGNLNYENTGMFKQGVNQRPLRLQQDIKIRLTSTFSFQSMNCHCWGGCVDQQTRLKQEDGVAN
jgi:hypothetical protein